MDLKSYLKLLKAGGRGKVSLKELESKTSINQHAKETLEAIQEVIPVNGVAASYVNVKQAIKLLFKKETYAKLP